MAHQQQRSRLRLGLSGTIYVSILILMAGTSIYTQANLLFWLLGLMTGAMVVSLVLAMLTLRNVEVHRLVPDHAVAGDTNVLRYHITNHSWLPIFGLMIVETWGADRRGWKQTGPVAAEPPMLYGRPHGWVMHIGPRQTIQAEAPCWPLRRGKLAFERLVLSSAFPFGIMHKVVEIEQPDELLVYPQLFRLNRQLLFTLTDHDHTGQKLLERGGGMEEFFGLRPYRYGDSLKMIDWRHSARTGELVSREMTQPSPPRIMVLVDMRKLDEAVDLQPPVPESDASHKRRWWWPRRRRRQSNTTRPLLFSPRQRTIERTISLAASVVCEAHFQGYQVGLAMVGCRFPRLPIHHSLPHRTRMLEALAGLNADHPQTGDDALPARPSVIVSPGAGTGVTGQRGPAGAVVFGAAQLERYVLKHESTHQLLQATERAHTRREQLQHRAAVQEPDAPEETEVAVETEVHQ